MPNIAVLSDPNRPTKLAEMSSEIFDNEWTDAYEMLVDDKEKNKISFMLHLFKDVDTLCGNFAKQHDEAVTTSLTQMVIGFKERKRPYEPECSQTEDVYEEKSEVIRFKFDKLSPVQKQNIDDITRTIQSDLAEQVTEAICYMVLKENGPNHADEIRNYVLKCSRFCWTARSHNPPVYVDFIEVMENMRLDTNVYKPYTRTGPLVDYIVWPPIYLHKGGPMLSKGVAQGKKNN